MSGIQKFLGNIFAGKTKETPEKDTRIVVLKISGEAFGTKEEPLEQSRADYLAREISKIQGVRFAVVPGGGNILRGAKLKKRGFDPAEADYLGMLSTIYNAVSLKNSLKKLGVKSVVMSQLNVDKITLPYSPSAASEELARGTIVIAACGTGNPFVTTDTAAALRALELKAGAVIKGTKVSGVYSADPVMNHNAVFYPEITYNDAIKKELGVCDQTALSLLKNSGVNFYVINIFESGNLENTLAGKCPGTVISGTD